VGIGNFLAALFKAKEAAFFETLASSIRIFPALMR